MAVFRSKLLWGVAAPAVLAGSYTLAGFYLVPYLVRMQGTQWVKDTLHKNLSLGEIRFNPFTFEADIDAIALPDREPANPSAHGQSGKAAPMLSIGHFHLAFSVRSLFGPAYRLREVRIDRPVVHAVLRPDGTLNLADLVPPSSPGSKGESPAFRIDRLTIDQGQASFVDLGLANHPSQALVPLSFTLRDFETARGKGGAFTLKARSESDEELAWAGHIGLAPLGSRGTLAITRLQARTVQDFIGSYLPLTLRGGTASFRGDYALAYTGGAVRLTAHVPELRFEKIAFAGKPSLFRGQVTIDRAETAIPTLVYRSAGQAGSADGSMAFQAAVPGLSLSGLGIAPPSGSPMRVPGVRMADARLDYAAHSFQIGSLTLTRPSLAVRREADGAIDLMRMMPRTQGGANGQEGASAAWNVALGALRVDQARVRFEDRTVSPAARFDVFPATISAGGIGSDLARPMTIGFEARVNGQASAGGQGVYRPSSGHVDMQLKLANLTLALLRPYLPHLDGIDLRSATLGGEGRVALTTSNLESLRFQGDASIDDVSVVETATNNPFVQWRRFGLAGIDYGAGGVTVARGHLVAPLGRVEILPDGVFNFTALSTGDKSAQAAPSGPSAPTPVPAKAPAPAPAAKPVAVSPAMVSPALKVKMNHLAIEGATMGFADYSIQPNFEVQVDNLHGSLANISNVPGAITRIDLGGYVGDRFSPADINGTMDLFGYDRQTDMHAAFRNIELPVLNPYSGRYAGYAIARGKLTAQFDYRIENRALKAGHHVVIDQLKWGSATNSKDKVPLPVRLATSLLKDKNGVIKLDVPVTGSLDDPRFRIGPIIWQIIGNVIEKAITAPFRLLGSIFGGAEKARYVDFAPGSADLPEGAGAALSSLSKALEDREELRLVIPAGLGTKEDALAMADRRINAALVAKNAKGGVPADPASLKPNDLLDRLRTLYRVKLGRKPVPPAFDKTAPAPDAAGKGSSPGQGERRKLAEIDWLRGALRQAYLPSDAELAKLGAARATAVRDALLTGSTIAPERVFMATDLTVTDTQGTERAELKLE